MGPFFKLLAISLLVLPVQALAQDGRLSFGGDQFTAGQSAQVDAPVARDVFATGYDVTVRAPVSGDAHLAGFNVAQSADVAGDLYAAGFSVSLTGKVGGDITAMGNMVSVTSPQPVAGLNRVGVLAVSIVVTGLLGMIPLVGWLLTLAVLCFGFGAIAAIIMGRLSSSDRPAFAAAAQTPEAI